MFLRSTNRRKDGKDHRYFSIVENRRLAGGKTAQRTVLYLGEINDRQQAAWRKTLDVFDEAEQRFTSLSLFPDDREVPVDAIDSVSNKCLLIAQCRELLREVEAVPWGALVAEEERARAARCAGVEDN